ncbi:MAG TPA: metallophosphoesterase [Acidobacteriota bacterium]|nr:metallophosphoesterase [Acidobacteriota bacterium]
MFFLIVFSIWALALTHIFLRTQQLLKPKGSVRILLGILLFLAGFSYVPARMMLAANPDGRFAGLLTAASALVIGFSAALWTLVFVFDIGAAAAWITTRKSIKHLSNQTCRMIAATLWGLAGVLSVLGFLVANSTPSVSKLELTVPNGEASRFVVISDVHLGAASLRGQWTRTLEAASELKPHAILIPGDLIDDHGRRTWSQLTLVREIFPTEPVYITTGNHEFYAGTREFLELCEKLQFRVLRQEATTLSPGLTVAGIDDAHFMSASRAVEEIKPKMQGATILLTHRPASAYLLRERPMTLVLAGHTHGGQTLPVVCLVALGNGGFRSGLYKVGDAHLYVSRGTGVWGPLMRILAPPELVLIEVQAGERFEVMYKR